MKIELIYEILIIASFALIIFNVILKLIGYSFKARKYGLQAKAIVVGYSTYYTGSSSSILWFPVVKFVDNFGNEIIAKCNSTFIFPIFKIGKEINIRYYKLDTNKNDCYTTIYVNRITTKKDDVLLNPNYRFVFTDYTQYIDIIIELIIFIVLFLFKIFIF